MYIWMKQCKYYHWRPFSSSTFHPVTPPHNYSEINWSVLCDQPLILTPVADWSLALVYKTIPHKRSLSCDMITSTKLGFESIWTWCTRPFISRVYNYIYNGLGTRLHVCILFYWYLTEEVVLFVIMTRCDVSWLTNQEEVCCQLTPIVALFPIVQPSPVKVYKIVFYARPDRVR